MVHGTNKGLASHITENPNIIQNKRQDWKHIENSHKTALKVVDDGIILIEVDNVVIFAPKGPKEQRQLIPDWLSSTSYQNPSLHRRFHQKVQNKP